MVKYVDWMAKRRGLNLCIIAVYFLVVLYMHDPLVKLSVMVMNYFTRQVYDVIVGVVAFVLLAGIIYYFIRKLTEHRQAIELKIGYLITVVSLIFLHSQVHFVMNIELIHTVEFGIMALLIFPLVKRVGDTAFYTILLGAADEWFQYRVLYPEKSDYFDFNDLITNMLGAGFALVLLYAAGVNNKSYPSKIKIYKSPVLYIAAIFVVFTGVLFKMSLIQTYAGNEKAWFVLSKAEGPEKFWRNLPDCEIVYHVLRPQEGIALLVLLLALFFLFDVLARKQLSNSGASPFSRKSMASPVF
ncbi:MAG: VanZ family protein [Chitinophagales bacterium]|nr:VanZ family protein [Chitinophagales bacterium]